MLVRFGPGWWEDLTGALSAPDRDETGAVVDAGTVSSFELRPGDCFTISDVSSASVDEAEVVPCSQPHLFEAYAEYVFPGKSREPYPGETAIVEVANDFCFGEFETFVGLAWEDSVLDFVYLYPEPDGWAAGDRVVLCVVAPLEGTLTGSMAGAAR